MPMPADLPQDHKPTTVYVAEQKVPEKYKQLLKKFHKGDTVVLKEGELDEFFKVLDKYPGSPPSINKVVEKSLGVDGYKERIFDTTGDGRANYTTTIDESGNIVMFILRLSNGKSTIRHTLPGSTFDTFDKPYETDSVDWNLFDKKLKNPKKFGYNILSDYNPLKDESQSSAVPDFKDKRLNKNPYTGIDQVVAKNLPTGMQYHNKV